MSPNVDTLYSIAWLDLSAEPLVLTVPDARAFATPDGDARYYLLQMLDAWTNVFDSPGLRTRGPDARSFLLAGPGWDGPVPSGLERINAPTSLVWITGRTEVLDAADMPVVHRFQNELRLIPLSKWAGPFEPPVDVPVNERVDVSIPPIDQVEGLDAEQFFSELTFEPGQWPPANAFWSLTLYDSDQAVVHNSIDRYALGDRSDLVANPGGSLTIFIQQDAPGGAMANNWLPTPQGGNQAFNLIMRVYWPKPEMFDGSWVVPPVRRVTE